VPVLILHGANDGLVSPQDSMDLFNSIGSKDKGLFIYPELCHEIFNEPVKQKVLDDVVFWLTARV
jgi:lysophospholipase